MLNEPMFLLYLISFLVWSLLCLIVGFLVYREDPRKDLNKRWFYLSLFVSAWSLGRFMIGVSTNAKYALFWGRFLHIFAVAIPVLYIQFIYALTENKDYPKKFIKILYFLTLIFGLSAFTDYFIKGVEPRLCFPFYEVPGEIYPIWTAVWVGMVAFAIYELVRSAKAASGLKRNQLKFVLIASVMGFAGGSTSFLPVYNIPVHPIGAPFAALYPSVIAYAIVKYRLMDISIVIKKGTVYTYLSFLVLIPCMLFIIIAQRFFFGEINYAFCSLVFGLLLLAAIIFSRTKLRVERFIERILFKEKYEYKRALSKLSKVIISFLDEKKLFKKTSYILTHSLGIEKNSFFLLDREKRAYTLRASKGLDKPKIKELPEDDLFFKWLKESGKIIVREELEHIIRDPKIKPIVETLNSIESEVCIPLITRGELIGIINLGRKRSGDMYSNEDLELLGNLANQAAVALENARLYEDMQKTQLLMRRSDRLAALGSLTAGLAHEIRNPLVAVKTFLQLLPERFDDEEFRSNFLSLTTSEVERITALVSELLEFARPSEPQLKRADVNEVLQKVIHLITVEAKKRGIAINSNLEEVPQAMLDEEQIKQVFLNIFLNAIEAIPSSGDILVTSRMTQRNGLEYVQVKIEDTGKGIPRKILDHIFDPFFTTKEKGSGLGLSISHQIVQEHNGSIEVESKSGKGTTFFVNLPCVK